MGLGETFAAACRWKGERPFLLDPYVRWSGDESLRQAWAAAAALRARGVDKGTTVAFLCAPSARHAIAFFACQMVGAVCCALHVKDSDPRLRRTLERIGTTVLVTDTDQAQRAAALCGGLGSSIAVLTIDPARPAADDLSIASSEPVALAAVAPGDPAVVLCSSGTTGDPKCVLHTHATCLATTAAGPFIYGVSNPSDGLALPMAPSFAAWIHTVLPFVYMRGTLYFQDRFDPATYLDMVAAEGLTVAALVPTAWRMVLNEKARPDLPHLKVAFYSGEKGTTELVRQLADLAPSVRTAYLASEGGCAAAVVADETVLRGLDTPASVGQPVPGADLKLIAPDGGFDDVLSRGETGEIAIRGASVAAGYLGDEALTGRQFHDGWWRTGDLGFIDDNGQLSVRGRKDNRINSGGIKIHAEEVENALLQHPSVRDAAVIGVDDPVLGERIEAHVVVSDDGVSPSDILDFCDRGALLPRALLPKAVHICQALPVSPTGKLYRKGLRGADIVE